MNAAAPSAPATPAAEATACLNCAQPLAAGPYCPHCGQARPHRLSVPHLLHELLHVFTHADKSIFGYAAQVLRYPGRVVADYLAGRRKVYFNPFQFLLLAVGFATLLSTQLHYYELIGENVQRGFRAGGASAEQVERVGRYFYAIGKFFNVWWLTLMPLHALGVWAVYRRWLNYAESLFVLVVVGSAFQLYLMVALVSIFLVAGREPGSSTALMQAAVYVAYLTWVGRQGLRLSWPRAVLSALVVSVLAGLLNYGVNILVFRWYVFGH
ncbi:DUF3667 domain-containing protein [Hymenobacter busanensis]|uniref:DUF3667 domain-containing protein n=1 Tax=Hymenobacter busanensis TaxID=2607656 RepID=A0A7L4ZW72_9BACT|nr:DUF3667 domain-containing protein [Hymenobacter busanensis]KAA9332420.1 DUF3667 domain-containing protein [Hymenobacter busanensis]QHJ07243.1 DUF3667 domain-containing protein [Hymenobacter busanensis]